MTESLIRDLTPAELAMMRAPRGAKVRIGGQYRLWQIKGLWYAWSDGPETGTYWMAPLDEEATDVVELLSEKVELGRPVVVARTTGAIAVGTKQIRPQALEL